MNKKIISEQIVTTRNDHKCYGCGRNFTKGSSMNSAVCKINGNVSRRYFCEACHHTMVTTNKTIDQFCYGDLLRESLTYEKQKRHLEKNLTDEEEK